VFATDDRPFPCGLHRDQPQEWHRYWLESLAEAGITGLVPVQDGSWHVPTSGFTARGFPVPGGEPTVVQHRAPHNHD
jgi:hypothetical protein